MVNKIEELAEKIYNLSSILKQYCRTNVENLEEVTKISTLVDYLHNDADKLNSILINTQ